MWTDGQTGSPAAGKAAPPFRRHAGSERIAQLATFLLLAGLLISPPVDATFATGGSGRFTGSIDWFEWGPDGASIPSPAGTTQANTRTIAGLDLVTTCSIDNVLGDLEAYRSGNGSGDAFDDLYHTGGADGANTMVAGLRNSVGGATVSFDLSCSATLDGAPIALNGLVFADAEASTASAGDYVEATAPPGTTWRILDRYRGTGCSTSTIATLTGDTLRLAPNGDECFTVNGTEGPVAVGFMEGATSATVALKGGGVSAVAVGVVIDTDFGDAPASYGEAGALLQPVWTNGVVTGTTDVFAMSSLAFQLAPATRLGTVVDSERDVQTSADATGDNSTGSGDEDSIASPITITTTAGAVYTRTFSCTGPGFVKGWIDWIPNGVFDTAEGSDTVECTGFSVNLSWTVPAGTLGTTTFMRLRMAPTATEVALPTGMSIGGEVEDHQTLVAGHTISGFVEEDTTGDGLADGPLAGVTIELVDSGSTVLATTTTQADGSYTIGGVLSGTYTVREVDPAGYLSVDDADGGTDNVIAVTVSTSDVNGRDFLDEPIAPSLSLTKSIVSTSPNPLEAAGGTITYGFSVTNTGNVTLTGVTVTDPLATVSGGPVTLAPGATDSSTFTAGYLVTQADVDAGYVDNRATASGTDPFATVVTDVSDAGDEGVETPDGSGSTDGDPTNDPTTYAIAAGPELRLVKSVVGVVDDGDGETPGVGDLVNYGFSVTNTGNVTLTGVTVTDPLATVSGGPVTLAPGASDTSTFTGSATLTQADVDAGGVENVATASGLDPGSTAVVDTSDAGTDPSGSVVAAPAVTETASPLGVNPNNSGDPTDDPTTLVIPPDPELTLVKTVGSGPVNNGDGSYSMSYTFKVQNTGTVTLTGLQIDDPIGVATFTGDTTYSVVSSTVLTGDCTVSPAPFDGNTATGLLDGADVHDPGEVCILSVDLLVNPGADPGPHGNTATAMATPPSGPTVTDISDAGNEAMETSDADGLTDGDPTNDPTLVFFDESPSLGTAKSVTSVTNNQDGTYDVGYELLVENVGDIVLTDVQIDDDLSVTFGAPVSVRSVAVVAGTCTAAGDYDGVSATGLLAGTDILAVGDTCRVALQVTVTPGSSLGPHRNTAIALGTSPASTVVSDLSADGWETDPDGDGDPSDDSDPTPVSFTENPELGVSKRLIGGPSNADDVAVYRLTYQISVTNTGNVPVNGLRATDNLAANFGSAPFAVGGIELTEGTCALSGRYNGTTHLELLGTGVSLAVGDRCVVTIDVSLTPGDGAQTISNIAVASGTSPAGAPVADRSTDGDDNDADGDGTPTNDSVPTTFETVDALDDLSSGNAAGQPVTVDPVVNDPSAGELDPGTVQLRNEDGEWVTGLTVPGEGTWTVDPATGHVTFTPVGFTVDPTPVTYRIGALAGTGERYTTARIVVTYLAAETPTTLAFTGGSLTLLFTVGLTLLLVGAGLLPAHLNRNVGRTREQLI